MPATMTHAFFSKDVYDIMPTDIKENLNIKRVIMFGQSTDSFIFYNLFSLKSGKKMREFQHTFHTKQSQEFFLNLLRYIKDNNIKDVDTYSFMVGFICHYVLDSIVHPYIFYKTGEFIKHEPSTYKYNGIHHFMEIFLDNDMIRRRFKTNPYKFKIYKYCFDLRPFSYSLNKTINYTFFNTYNMKDMSSKYYKSLKDMKKSMRIFRYDPYGFKKDFYKLIDTFTTNGTFRFEAISYYYPLNDKHNFLNNSHSTWRNPTTYSMTSNESFIDLYLKAIKLAKVMICASFDYINNKDIDLEKIFINNSYTTGINCDSDKKMKYFEF